MADRKPWTDGFYIYKYDPVLDCFTPNFPDDPLTSFKESIRADIEATEKNLANNQKTIQAAIDSLRDSVMKSLHDPQDNKKAVDQDPSDDEAFPSDPPVDISSLHDAIAEKDRYIKLLEATVHTLRIRVDAKEDELKAQAERMRTQPYRYYCM